MSKSIFDFVPNEDSNIEKEKIDKSKVESMYNHYKDYSQQDLMQELFRVASSEKEKGTLTKEK